jgi:predicted Rdx family selenoprotein
VVAGGVYGLDVFAQTMKAINGFEITYNGQVLHSKLASGKFPESDELVTKLRRIISQENPANHD